MAPYERFDAWRLSHELVLAVYRLTAAWPVHERYGLVSQVRRAAVSIASNIAEGAAKRGHREFRRYVDISLGSLSELTYLLRLALDLGYLTEDDHRSTEQLRNRTGQMTWRLYQAISAKAR